ncbi:uncharacterized protein BYT42DRAFT_362914 [Radiomyces spectabilis]|uniref:uncharacterized protein n=1 Tax=Radiomyces spectabilis TaxID=64574 RepID=UPI00221E7032|nr:uncharacterized protein BYT42DRAFT_362914 [Radiomyces spectabilis]KAI8377955.1 hypothetical protein BYT42DRAFT_362914 [Radiomyces spectabilis]
MDEHGFVARLRHLEHILVGQQVSHLSRDTQLTLLKRVHALKSELNNVYKNNKTLQAFMDKYDAHAKLLNPNESSLAMEHALLTPETKLELVLAAQDELETFAADIKQVKSLEHVVSGTEFEVVEKQGAELSCLEVAHAEQAKQLAITTQKLSSTMDTYNGVINTLSEIFISWDDILTTMETHVAALERQKAAA